MSTLTLPNAEPAESDFHSKIVLNLLSTDDNAQVVTVLISKQPELDTEHGRNAFCIAGMEFKLFKRTNWKLILKNCFAFLNWVYVKNNQDIQETYCWKWM